jgi:hypothetical protein
MAYRRDRTLSVATTTFIALLRQMTGVGKKAEA